MNLRFSLVVGILCIASLVGGYQLPNGGKIWALLVAGSNYYGNYRHQADVCHAYQLLHSNGIPDENIIVMMYDDIANSDENPTPGIIINSPGGPNVYEGVLKDYTGKTVTPANFLKVLSGDEEGMKGIGSGRVIKSGPKDHVFVNFVDHGAPGLLAFPSEELYASDLELVLSNMSASNQFGKMVLYIEACESGSMFESLLSDTMNIFVTTAADPRESSYACYYDNERQTYLGDVYSVNWMQDAEQENLLLESLHHQFEVVRRETNTSHVEEYGNLDLGSLHVSEFMGFKMSRSVAPKTPHHPGQDAVHNRHVPVAILQRQLEKETDPEKVNQLTFKLRHLQKARKHLESVVQDIVLKVADGKKHRLEQIMTSNNKVTRQNAVCYKTVTQHFSQRCFKLSENSYALSQLYMFLNLCSEKWSSEDAVLAAVDSVCSSRQRLTGVV